ncbi:BZ3500_MvSof-1268-A1-R1_Chr1-1g00990 [Microbotryum saponariae]|uniref:BZ3500_MvSof-1268-A1-R1_Chr1-1g00990 protein n=1 Tax=Microbotryum saponariae TaxID=289078 RepID=A0A2X0KK20_9BASI|nr:BZ3500_MvSof-1268-A1-R1_Chr1-1g00990 [Microbotryum saponariae]SCZ93117.1 BZ3501_MvSof-1269-A2-R1_Chr1-1g00587 [Microbotryum saponariae]
MSTTAYTQRNHRSTLHTTTPKVDTSCQLSFAPRNTRCQPLYRPAALRRNGSQTPVSAMPVSPPVSPHALAAELSQASIKAISPQSWLGVLPWASDVNHYKSGDSSVAAGVALPRSAWRPDEEALICAASDCSLRFDLINRRHHCRKCGEVFCSSHSSRMVSLWPPTMSPGEHDISTPPTPRATPKSTPRSSYVDLSSLAFAASSSSKSTNTSNSAFSVAASSESSNSSSTPTSSPPNGRPFLGKPMSCRVCDSCYFNAPASVPQALLTPPPTSSTRSFMGSPKGPMSQSPPNSTNVPEWAQPTSTSRSKSRSRSRHDSSSGLSRSRHGSASGSASSTPPSFVSTPPTSYDSFSVLGSNPGLHNKSRGVSPAASLRGAALLSHQPFPTVTSAIEDDDGDITDEELIEEEEEEEDDVHVPKAGMLVASETSFGPRGFDSLWSTF